MHRNSDADPVLLFFDAQSRTLTRRNPAPLACARFSASDWRLDQTLDYLYGRECAGRGLAGENRQRGSARGPSALRAVDWLARSRKLFARETFERMQAQAQTIERYRLTELLENPDVLRALDATPALTRALLGMRGRLSAQMRAAVREIIQKTLGDITRRLKNAFVDAIVGRRNRLRRSQVVSAQNSDARATVAAHPKHYDAQRRQFVIERPRFNARVRPHLPWDVVLCVDQRGSMTNPVIYSAVIAGILAALPTVRVRLVAFDASVVDPSHLAHDPAEVLLTVQLGGGTDIGRAVRYCERSSSIRAARCSR